MKTMKIWRKTRKIESHASRFANGRLSVMGAIFFVVLATVTLASCSIEEPDGKWDSMVWLADTPNQITDGVINVSANGCEMTFSCRNYSSPWIENAEFAGEYYYPPREGNNYHTVTTDWFYAEMKGNKLKVTFERNETTTERPIVLTVTAGDIFYTFKFKQFANR